MRPVAVARFEPAPLLGVELGRVVVGRVFTVARRAEDQLPIHLKIGGEEDAVLVPREELPQDLRIVPAQLRDSCRQIGVHVGMLGELAVHPGEVFGVVGEVDADEGCLWMPSDHPVERA